MVAASFRRTHSPSRLVWSEGWRPVYIHQTNQVSNNNDFGHDDSTINISVAIIIIFLNLGRSSRGGIQKLILEIITPMVNRPSGSRQKSSRASG